MDPIKKFLFEATDSTDQEKSVKCVIKYVDKVLILRTAANTPGEGSWDLPGGHVKEKEAPKDALEREVREETRLRIKNIKSKKVVNIKYDTQKSVSTNIFSADAINDDVYLPPSDSNRQKFHWWKKPQPEHSEFKWIKYEDELDQLKMLDEYKDAIRPELKKRQT